MTHHDVITYQCLRRIEHLLDVLLGLDEILALQLQRRRQHQHEQSQAEQNPVQRGVGFPLGFVEDEQLEVAAVGEPFADPQTRRPGVAIDEDPRLRHGRGR